MAEFTINTPSTWSAQQVNDLATLLTNSPSSVFDATFLASYPEITGIEVTVSSTLPPVKTGLSDEAKLGIGVGVGVGGGLLVAGAVGVGVWRRRRRMMVEPRDELGAAEMA